jgi:hypothetical protein
LRQPFLSIFWLLPEVHLGVESMELAVVVQVDTDHQSQESHLVVEPLPNLP